MADHTAGAAAATLARPGYTVLTTEFEIRLLRPARGQKLECVAKVLESGRTLTVVESEVYCESESERALISKTWCNPSQRTDRQDDLTTRAGADGPS